MHELDEMSGSTPQIVISALFDMRNSRKFGIKKEHLTTEFPRKKEFHEDVEYSTLQRLTHAPGEGGSWFRPQHAGSKPRGTRGAIPLSILFDCGDPK